LELPGVGGDHHRDEADRNCCGDGGVAQGTEQAGDSAAEADDGEGADSGNAAAGLLFAQLPAALDSDQQPAGERRADRERLPVPAGVQLSLSACQRM
jgi:hypothetical protein